MFSLLLFFNPFSRDTRKYRTPTWGDEFMMGNWSISSFDLYTNETKSDHNLYLMPHMEQDALIGYLKQLNDLDFSYNLTLRFYGEDRDSFKICYSENEIEKELMDINFTYNDDNLLVAWGTFPDTNITYMVNMFSEVNMEITTFDISNHDITLYRLHKPDIHPQKNPIKQYIYAAMVLFYLYSRNKDKKEEEQ